MNDETKFILGVMLLLFGSPTIVIVWVAWVRLLTEFLLR